MKLTRQGIKLGHSRLFSTLAAGSSLLVMAGALAVATPAAAQVETVTVTAQYTQQNLQSTPLAISAVTSQDLENRGINDLASLASSVPSLTLTKTPTAFGSGVQTYIRGIGQYDTAFASEPGVGMYIDDEYYGTLFGSNLELIDLDRVEVLRGPQGVLGGKNNEGGAIRLISKKPTGDGSGYLQASYGSFDELDVKGAVDLTVVPDHLFLRVSAMSRTQDGFMNIIDYTCKFGPGNGPTGAGGMTPAHPNAAPMPSNTTRPDCSDGQLGGTNVQGARAALRYVVNAHVEDTIDAYVIRDNSESQAASLIVADPGNDPTVNPGNTIAWFNGSKVVQVPRNTFYPAGSGGPTTVTGPTAWNTHNLAKYGIPWDQRFIPADPYTQSYSTSTTEQGNQYKDGAMVHSYGINNAFEWDITDNIHFKNITGYRYYNAANDGDSDLSPMSYQLTVSYPSNREFQEEGRFTGTMFDDHLEWTAGVFYYHRNNHEQGPVDIEGAAAPFLQFEQNDRYKTTNKSVYVNMIYHVLDNLEVFGGARYTKETKLLNFDHSGQIPGYPTTGPLATGFFRDTVDPSLSCNLFIGLSCDHTIHPPLVNHISTTARPDWRGGADYHVTDDAMLYVSYSTGYRTGGFNSRPFTPAQLDSYGPETLKSWEVGAKTDWFDHRLRVNVSVYDADYTNIITPTAGTDPFLPGILPYVKYVNLASAKDKGFEVESFITPIDNMLIDASYSYTDLVQAPTPGAPAGYLDGCSDAGYAAGLCDANPKNLGFGVPAPHTSPGTIKVGSSPILFPKTTFHIGWQYMWGMGNAGSLTPRLDYAYQSIIYQGANNDPFTAVKARGLMDGRLTWNAPDGGWQMAFSVSNLTNKKYFLNVFDLSIFGQGSVEGQPGAPREWLLTLRKNF